MVKFWRSLTQREKWLGAGGGFFATLFAGSVVGRLIVFPHIGWDGIGTLVALVALPAAILGYFDNRRGQQLEHRAYIRLGVAKFDLLPDQPVDMKIELVNYGRTPAHNVQTLISTGILLGDITTMPTGRPQIATDTSVHPGTIDFVNTDGGFTISRAEYHAVQGGQTKLALRIVCLYDDIFGIHHETHLLGRVENSAGVVQVEKAPVGNWAN